MRNLANSAAALVLAGLLMGCPPPENSNKTPETPAETPADDAESKPADGTAEAEPEAEPEAAAPAGPDISHVKVGQKYTYEASGMQQVVEVKEITDTEIKYEMFMIMGETTTPATPGSYPLVMPEAPAGEPAGEAPAPPAEVGTETIEIAGVSFECKIIESGGDIKSWVSNTWAPMGVKTMQGDKVLSELKGIE